MSEQNSLKNKIAAYLRQCVEKKIFPGCAAGIISGGRSEIICDGNLTYEKGSPEVTEDTVYDIASITKSIPTACCALKLIEEGKIALQSRLIDFIPEFEGAFREEILIRHLLSHTLDFNFRLSDKKDLPPREILGSILTARLRTPPGTSFCYANATSVLLGLVVERAAGETLDKAAGHCFFGPLGMKRTTFFPETLGCAAKIAPSETDAWRGRVICGEVHDESAWALRPLLVAGSAGLFSTASDLLRFLTMLMNGGKSGGRRIFKPATVRLMHENALSQSPGISAALGWELDNHEFMGTRRSSSLFGKTGFTGCAIVADPLCGAGYVLLANHTFPRRRDDRTAINRVRNRLADLVFIKKQA
jgi:CubicO group peptidase (beta-lactamase class C family)